MKRISRAEIWGLSQGLLGRARATLAPSLAAVGPNTYLNQNDFFKMLGAAFLVHALIFTVAALMPHDTVTSIPVRALSFKLGDQDRVAAFAPAPTAAPSIAAPSMSASSSQTWRATPNTPAPVTPPPLKPVTPTEKIVEAVKPVKQVKTRPVPAPKAEPVPVPVAQPAVAATPQQYVREVGAPTPQAIAAAVAAVPAPAGTPTGAIGGAGADSSMTAQSMQAIRARYEQEISAWIQRHKYYPSDAGGREGRAIVRMRIDRAGNVRYYAIEQSAGLTALDLAALDMIRRANPVPAVPTTYPAGNLVEFLIPITFKAPQ